MSGAICPFISLEIFKGTRFPRPTVSAATAPSAPASQRTENRALPPRLTAGMCGGGWGCWRQRRRATEARTRRWLAVSPRGIRKCVCQCVRACALAMFVCTPLFAFSFYQYCRVVNILVGRTPPSAPAGRRWQQLRWRTWAGYCRVAEVREGGAARQAGSRAVPPVELLSASVPRCRLRSPGQRSLGPYPAGLPARARSVRTLTLACWWPRSRRAPKLHSKLS